MRHATPYRIAPEYPATFRRLLATLLALCAALNCACSAPPRSEGSPAQIPAPSKAPERAPEAKRLPETKVSSLSVYALSRGKGVPDKTQAVFDQMTKILQTAERDKKITKLTSERIGIEGETRLCAEFSGPDAAREIEQRLSELARGIDLIKIASEACSAR